MVQSIWLEFKEEVDPLQLFIIVNEKFPLDLYNEMEENPPTIDKDSYKRWSVEGGYRLKNDALLRRILRVVDSRDLTAPSCDRDDCEFCETHFKTMEDRIAWYFGIRIEGIQFIQDLRMSPNIGRNIWGDVGYDIFDSRLRLLYGFLVLAKQLMDSKGIKCEIDTSDCPDIKKELKTIEKKVLEMEVG